MIGYTLADRYETLEKIGSGGMGDVYKAYDKRLDRIVALKVLKSEYNEDESFVRKFRRESLAAASISHPNIVSIYDVGSEILNGQTYYYIVMEYIDGRTLKEIIQEEGPLPIKQALHFTLQIAEALKVAHAKHIVHRDIKSQNIMVTKDHRVKVTDFGIARIVGNSTVTMTDSVMGSVHYFSPEQARGSKIDTRSDIYSLGIVLFEMLTGGVPYDGENPISVALMHIQNAMPMPSEFNPNVDVAVDDIFRKMTMKDPKDRIQKVEDLITLLKAYLLNPKTSKKRVLSQTRGQTQPLSQEEILRAQSQQEASKRASRKPAGKKTKEKSPKKKSGGGLGSFLGVLIAILLFGGVVYGGYRYLTRDGKDVLVLEDYVNQPIAEVQEKLESQGLLIKILEERETSDLPPGTILEQDPHKGVEVKKGDTVSFVISTSPSSVRIPSVEGRSYDEARSILNEAGLTIGKVTYEYSKDIPEKMALDTEPKSGNLVKAGSSVALIVSKGENEEVSIVPDLKGNTVDLAKKYLEQAGLKLGGVNEKVDGSVGVGEVVSQSYEPGTKLPKGSSVNIIIRKADGDGEDQGESNNRNQEKSVHVKVNVPQDDQSHQLTVQREGSRGTETVVDRSVEGGQSPSLRLNGRPGDVFKVYIDGDQVNSYTVGS